MRNQVKIDDRPRTRDQVQKYSSKLNKSGKDEKFWQKFNKMKVNFELFSKFVKISQNSCWFSTVDLSG